MPQTPLLRCLCMSQAMRETWERWCSELLVLCAHPMPHSYFLKEVDGTSTQLHGFCDVSESAYSRVVYLRAVDQNGSVHVSLVMAKTKAAPIKCLTIPTLELCGAVIVAKILSHTAKVLNIPTNHVYTWSDSVALLSWLRSNPRLFKTFVGI